MPDGVFEDLSSYVATGAKQRSIEAFDGTIRQTPPNVKERRGHRYGRLVGVTYSHSANHQAWWWYQCDCGKHICRRSHSIGRRLKSCGCLHAEVSARNAKIRKTTHGLGTKSLRNIRSGMIARCYNKDCEHYNLYGGRGITICEEWRKSPRIFYSWACGAGYQDGLQIDRVDNNGGYYPDNCRWVTAKVNSNNKNNNVRLRFNGETLTLAQWADRSGMSPIALAARLRRGWSIEKALTVPLKIYKKRNISPVASV